jgi:hypothetical protein
LGDLPVINTLQATSSITLGFNQPGNSEQIAIFLINSNSATGFTVTFTFANEGKFKAGTPEIAITGLLLNKVSGTLGDGLAVPTNEPITLDGSGSWTWDPGNTPTTETVNCLLEIKASWTNQQNAVGGFYTETISATIDIGA